MRVLYLPKFARQFTRMPRAAQDAAIERERWFRVNPFDPRLHTHKLKGPLDGFWSFSITNRYRIIFDFAEANTVRFYTIGDHDVYDV